jgi:hypothetical protein
LVALSLQLHHLIAEARLYRAWEGPPDDFSEVTAGKAGESSLSGARETLRGETSGAAAIGVDKPHLPDLISIAPDLRQQSHPFDQVEALAPKVDHVAAIAELRSNLDDRRLEAELVQPPSERWSCDACSADQDFAGPCHSRND